MLVPDRIKTSPNNQLSKAGSESIVGKSSLDSLGVVHEDGGIPFDNVPDEEPAEDHEGADPDPEEPPRVNPPPAAGPEPGRVHVAHGLDSAAHEQALVELVVVGASTAFLPPYHPERRNGGNRHEPHAHEIIPVELHGRCGSILRPAGTRIA